MNKKMLSKRLISLLCALVITGCATPRTPHMTGDIAGESGALDEWREAAEIELRQGEPVRAAFWLGRVLEQEPEQWPVRIELARILLNEGQLETVLSVLAGYALHESAQAEAEEIIATVFLRRGQFDEARRHLDRSLTADPDHWRSWNALGVLFDLEGHAPTAREHYREALRHSPDNPKVLNNLGYSYFLSGELGAAEYILRRGQSLAPDHVRMAVNLGIVLAWQSRDQEAVNVLMNALGESAASNNVGYVAMLNQRHEDARYWLETAVSNHVRYYVRASENLRRNTRQSRIGLAP